MAMLEFKQDLKTLIKLAGTSASEGKYVLCVHNLEDAMKIAADGEEKSAVYRCFSDLFTGIGNVGMARNALFRACLEMDRGGYYSLSYDKFIQYEDVIEEDELPPSDSDAILGYNDAYNFFITGQYEKGLDILCELPPDIRALDEVIGVLYDAMERGVHIDLTKHAYKLLLLAGIYSAKNGDFVRLLLQGSEPTRGLMKEGVNFFLEEINDKKVLSTVAQAYVDEGEYECAEKCFDKMLEECEIDEQALFYKAAICFHKGDSKEGKKYWNIYKLVYGKFGAPIEPYEKKFFFETGATPIDRYCSDIATLVSEDAEEIRSGGWNVNIEKRLAERVLSFANETQFLELLPIMPAEEYIEAYKNALISPFVSPDRKKLLMEGMIRDGYEGRVAVANEGKASIFDMIRFATKANRSLWQDIFVKVSVGIIFHNEFIPYRPSFIAHNIKQFAKSCAENKIKITDEDSTYLNVVVGAAYNQMAKRHTNVGWVKDIIPQISSAELKRGLAKFPPEKINV